MITLHKHASGVYRVRFRYGGRRFNRSLKTAKASQATRKQG
jgi:hypothetical protein